LRYEEFENKKFISTSHSAILSDVSYSVSSQSHILYYVSTN